MVLFQGFRTHILGVLSHFGGISPQITAPKRKLVMYHGEGYIEMTSYPVWSRFTSDASKSSNPIPQVAFFQNPRLKVKQFFPAQEHDMNFDRPSLQFTVGFHCWGNFDLPKIRTKTPKHLLPRKLAAKTTQKWWSEKDPFPIKPSLFRGYLLISGGL